MEVHLLKYGSELRSKDDYTAFAAAIAPPAEAIDRSGAPSEDRITDVVNLLKAEHGRYLVGPEMAWRLWAISIAGLRDLAFDAAVRRLPSADLVHNFATTLTPESTAQAGLRIAASLALNVNQSRESWLAQLRSHLQGFKQQVNSTVSAFEAALSTLHDSHEEIRNRFDVYYDQTSTVLDKYQVDFEAHLRHIQHLQQAIPAREVAPGLSDSILSSIPLHNDLDHMPVDEAGVRNQ
ncbi:hypothetical protein HDU96_002611 [Phlyctochytrium bullatum]|nr:hypothetical protein HDU96_002611 [Phlyctochytrium bullatum]